MSKQIVATGLFTVQDESTSVNKWQQIIEDAWSTITGVKNYSIIEQELIVGDGTVALTPVGPLKGAFLWVSGNGTVTFKHDSNTNGANGTFFMVNGTISNITIATTATTAITVSGILIEG